MNRRIAGVDGCRAGWLRIERKANDKLEAATFSSAELFATAREFDVLTIDIPIGLTDTGRREVDTQARRLLGPRASSVFPAPVRAALDGVAYVDACERSFVACGKKLSKQTFAILPKIREVDIALRGSRQLQAGVREVHPEVCFYFLNSAQPMLYPKKSVEGALERLKLLE